MSTLDLCRGRRSIVRLLDATETGDVRFPKPNPPNTKCSDCGCEQKVHGGVRSHWETSLSYYPNFERVIAGFDSEEGPTMSQITVVPGQTYTLSQLIGTYTPTDSNIVGVASAPTPSTSIF